MEDSFQPKIVKPRRSHCKSRNGCLECKKRRVKCDEKHPICGPCAKRQLPCGFPESKGQTPRIGIIGSPASSGSVPSSPMVRSAEGPQPDRLLELRLFHHFATDTYATIAFNALDQSVMQSYIPKTALSHPFLLDIILALAALHHEHLDPTRSKAWLKLGLDYQTRALKGFTKTLQDITPQNCEAATLCSMLILVSFNALLELSDEPYTADPFADFLSKRTLLEGIRTILLGSEELLKSGDLKDWFTQLLEPNLDIAKDLWKERMGVASLDVMDPKIFSPAQAEIRSTTMRSLDYLRHKIAQIQSPHQEMLLGTSLTLRNTIYPYTNYYRLTSAIISWPLTLNMDYLRPQGDAYLSLMMQLIILHYGVTLLLVNHGWYARGAGRRLVGSLLLAWGMGPEGQEEWRSTFEWARQAVARVEGNPNWDPRTELRL